MTTGENSRPVLLLLAITVIHYGDNGKGTDSNGGFGSSRVGSSPPSDRIASLLNRT